ncbi:putative uncharacterized protein DDB_G0282129 [Aplysia californica]|uniref:Uncharacterized protein n=1 Tax=Aplysia californica TaxID=6500 RepID=A0ABM0ZXH0_APLCA|nr:putative uncharacterized protein DDB_G0282129 [Aplysia californica]
MSLTPRFAPTAPITNSGGFLSTAQRRLPPLRQQSHPQPHHHQQQQQQHQQHHQRRSHHPALSLNATKSGHSIGDGDRLNNSSSNNSNKHNHNHNNNNHNNSYNASNNGMASSRLGVSHHRNSGAPAYDNASPVSLTTGTSGAHRLSSSSAVGASGGLKGRRSSPRQRQQQQNHHYLQRTSMQKMAPQSNIGSDLAVQDLTPEVVSQYLRQNPDVLEQHVIHHVTSERIEKWLHKKAQQSASKNRDGTTNGRVFK